jgi:hypothetical protein
MACSNLTFTFTAGRTTGRHSLNDTSRPYNATSSSFRTPLSKFRRLFPFVNHVSTDPSDSLTCVTFHNTFLCICCSAKHFLTYTTADNEGLFEQPLVPRYNIPRLHFDYGDNNGVSRYENLCCIQQLYIWFVCLLERNIFLGSPSNWNFHTKTCVMK